MNRKPIDEVIENIRHTYRDHIKNGARHYIEVNIGKQAQAMGYQDIQQKYRDAYAVVPLKQPIPGMKVRIDGRTFVNYAEFDSGIAVPGYVVKDTGMNFKTYVPWDSMVLNCA